MQKTTLRVLVVDDDPADIELIRRHLSDIPTWQIQLLPCGSADQISEFLRGKRPDVVLLDYRLGPRSGLDVLRDMADLKDCYPVIVVTGTGGEDVAVQCMKLGAEDYLVKGLLTQANLERAILNALEKHQLRREAEQHRRQLEATVEELRTALEHVKRLQGLLPICMHCKRIRNDQNAWEVIEVYIRDHSEASFSHGICEECLEKYYPEHSESRP